MANVRTIAAAPFRLLAQVYKTVTFTVGSFIHGPTYYPTWPVRPGGLAFGNVRAEDSSIVVAAVRWIQRTFTEAPAIIDEWLPAAEEWRHHPMEEPILDLLERPNPFYSGATLWKATLADRIFSGISYWVKVRGPNGRVVQLWWAPAATITPVSDDPNEYISRYVYRPSGQGEYNLPPSEVIRFPDGIDPANPRLGLSPVRTLMREIYTDDEASVMTAALLKNMGIPGVIISPKDKAQTISQNAAEAVKKSYVEKFTGTHRGEPLVLEGSADVVPFGFSPQQLELRAIRGLPEERITAVLGINAAVLGLGAGLETTKVGAPQPLSAGLWTPTGAICMGDISPGQIIGTPAGWKAVRAVYPQGEQDIYRVTFQDGSTAECTGDHLWQITLPDKRHPVHAVAPLAAIAEFPWDKLKRTSIPLQGVTEFDEQPTLIPPYILGLLLGDGTFRHTVCFSNTAREIVEALERELPAGYTLRHIHKGDYRIVYDDHAKGRGTGNGTGNLHPFKDELRRLGLWMLYSHEKFIPDLYKFNSSEVRREVLRGLLDTDGFVNLHGQPALEQTSARLASDVTWMVQSLGGYTLQTRKRANREIRLIAGRPMASKHDRYHQSIVIADGQELFRYSAKRDRCRPRGKAPTRKFRAIEMVRREQTQCISVDGGLYLTDNFIVTHNTLREYREEAFESSIIPMYRELSADLTMSLLPDFYAGAALKNRRVNFDLAKIRVLQDDEVQKATSLGTQLLAGGIKVSEYRRALGYQVLPEHDIYLRPKTHVEVGAGEDGQTVETMLGLPNDPAAMPALPAGNGNSNGAAAALSRLLTPN